MAVKISPSEARHILLRAQGLDDSWELPEGKEGAARVIERLGYVQIDTIAVIERAHHHILWTRDPGYEPAMLADLLNRDRRVFEDWTHAAAYVPMRDYRYYILKRRAFAKRPKTRQWLEENPSVVRHVRERIRAEGPLRSADFEDPRGERGPWWDWKPAKRALETLFRTGELMIAGRWNFQRLYDLTERILPPDVDASEPGPEEVARFVVRRTLESRGLISAKRAGWWLRDRSRVAVALEELVRSGEAVPVRIEGVEDPSFYARAAALEPAHRRRQSRFVHLLSPFDNLIIDRTRTSEFFGFDYRLECYTPASKRRYGYFTLPILWGEEFVGRLDPKVDRRRKMFHVRNLIWEPEFRAHDALVPALAERLRAFASFHGCEEIILEGIMPDSVRMGLMRALEGG